MHVRATVRRPFQTTATNLCNDVGSTHVRGVTGEDMTKRHENRRFFYLVQFVLKELFRRFALQSGCSPSGYSYRNIVDIMAQHYIADEAVDPEEIMA